MDYSLVNRIDYQLVEGDTGSKLRVTCKDNILDQPIDLTGAAVALNWKKTDGNLVSKSMTIVDTATGLVEYQFLAAEIEIPKMNFEIKITDSGGRVIRSLQLIHVPVRTALI